MFRSVYGVLNANLDDKLRKWCCLVSSFFYAEKLFLWFNLSICRYEYIGKLLTQTQSFKYVTFDIYLSIILFAFVYTSNPFSRSEIHELTSLSSSLVLFGHLFPSPNFYGWLLGKKSKSRVNEIHCVKTKDLFC